MSDGKNSFNEAEASLPRNTGQAGRFAVTGSIRFNEAEASLPRNTTMAYFVSALPSASLQ